MSFHSRSVEIHAQVEYSHPIHDMHTIFESRYALERHAKPINIGKASWVVDEFNILAQTMSRA